MANLPVLIGHISSPIVSTGTEATHWTAVTGAIDRGTWPPSDNITKINTGSDRQSIANQHLVVGSLYLIAFKGRDTPSATCPGGTINLFAINEKAAAVGPWGFALYWHKAEDRGNLYRMLHGNDGYSVQSAVIPQPSDFLLDPNVVTITRLLKVPVGSISYMTNLFEWHMPSTAYQHSDNLLFWTVRCFIDVYHHITTARGIRNVTNTLLNPRRLVDEVLDHFNHFLAFPGPEEKPHAVIVSRQSVELSLLSDIQLEFYNRILGGRTQIPIVLTGRFVPQVPSCSRSNASSDTLGRNPLND